MTLKTTIGQLVANLFANYEEQYRDEKLAAVATQVTVNDLMRSSLDKHLTRPLRRKAA